MLSVGAGPAPVEAGCHGDRFGGVGRLGGEDQGSLRESYGSEKLKLFKYLQANGFSWNEPI